MEHLKNGIYTKLHSTNKDGKIKVVVLHKPEIGNIWIYLWVDKIDKEFNEKHNRSNPHLISFKDYKTFCEYVGSKQFNDIFVIEEFKY